MTGRRSWSPEAQWQDFRVGSSGQSVVRGEELDRFELWVDPGPSESLEGFLRMGTRLTPLPAGSRLDAATGVFTWSPGPGFLGRYDLVFVRRAPGGIRSRRELRIVLAPRGTGRVGPQLHLDVLRPGLDVDQPFVLSGWSVDLESPRGTGVERVSAWAYPTSGGLPVFLGGATYGAPRPDVSSLHGPQFDSSGFTLEIGGLTPGRYDVVVSAWSRAKGILRPPAVVGVNVR
jgi:hypothetical protein